MMQVESTRVRFGEFELDLRAGELHRQGQAILLQEQSFRVLLALIERSGEIVTREELKTRLWPNDTVVEFDQGINAAIKRLRRALLDSSDQPKYIETLTRRGYRLLVPIQWIGCAPEDEIVAEGYKVRQTIRTAELVGKKISHYRVLQFIGGGGMGVVYKAEDLDLGRFVALKFLPEELCADTGALSRLQREARTASSLNHINICSIFELGTDQGQRFIAMELLEGQSLRDLLLENQRSAGSVAPVPVVRLLDIAIQICEGLKAAHEKGIIHRDIKPANIFITFKGVAKILDFGLAKLDQANESQEAGRSTQATAPADREESTALHISQTGVAFGTAAYMSPEQVRGEKLDPRTDVFSFGSVVYEMATGRQAFQGNTIAEVHGAILTCEPVPPLTLNPNLPLELQRLILSSLQKNRDVRCSSIAQMLADLEKVRQTDGWRDGSMAALKPSANKVSSTGMSRRRWLTSLFVCAVLLVIAVGGIVAIKLHRRKTQATTHDSRQQDLTSLGRQVVIELAAGQFDRVEARFDKTLSSAMPVRKVSAAWNAAVEQFGEFKSIKSIRNERDQQLRIVVVTCQFEYAVMDVVFGLDTDGLIHGLGILTPSSDVVSRLQSGPSTAKASKAASRDFNGLGKEVVLQLANGQFDKVERRFDKTMATASPPGNISKLWERLSNQFGRFKAIRGVHTEEMAGRHVAVLTCEFEDATQDLKIVFDDDGQIAGFFYAPTHPDDFDRRRPQALPKVTQNGAPDYISIAKQIILELNAGRYTDVEERFDKGMAAEFPLSKLSAVWDALTTQAGNFQSIRNAHVEEKDGFHVAVLNCEFEYIFLDIRVAVNDRAQIAGIRVVPPGTPDGSGAFNQGAAYFAKGDYERAIQSYNEVLRLNPNTPQALLNRGVASLYAGHFSDAQQDFSRYLQLDPTDPYRVIWLYLSRAKAGTDGKDELRTNAAALNLSTWPGPVIQLYLGQSTPEEVLRAAGSDSGQKCEYSFYVGEYLALRGEHSKALALFRSASDACPKDFVEHIPAVIELKHLEKASE